jgi:hypothetical protein
MKRSASRLVLGAVLLLAVVGLVLQDGSVPHVHASGQAGFFNADHDLTLLASLSAHALLNDPVAAVALESLFAPLSPSLPERRVTRPAHSGDSRAPPRS